MEKDLVYLFNKLPDELGNYIGNVLGEIQTRFNVGKVIDGTKDSGQYNILSFDEREIEPNSIIYHKKTNEWWIVSHDKIERTMNDSGFLYRHELSLLGAIELLNARDLTDCGFNDKTYTINEFITRLFSLSNFEYSINFAGGTNANFINKKVDFLKTFENYTLLSALREFLDAYNVCPKLSFNATYDSVADEYTINNAVLKLVYKTGDFSLTTHNIDDFDNVTEIITMDKESFGTCVVSNAENVISSKEKIYPATGSVRLSSTTNQINYSNAVLRLPSNVFYGKWLKIAYGLDLTLQGTHNGNDFGPETFKIFPNNVASVIGLKKRVIEIFDTIGYPTTFEDDFLDKFDTMAENIKKAGTITLYNGNKLVPKYPDANIVIEKGDDVPYLAELYDRRTAKNQKVIFADKETSNMLDLTYQSIAFERGSNKLTNFEMFRTGTEYGFELRNFKNTDLRYDDNQYDFYSFTSGNYGFQIFVRSLSQLLQIKNSEFILCYIPMSDLKIKVDNTPNKNDTQLYNQNGRITDNVALSKLLNSYSKEISSDTITRYMVYYQYSDVPEIGSIVRVTKDDKTYDYVINNISCNFIPNEDNDSDDYGYYIECEITMSKYCSTKSMLTSPNTNIRDYGIPQNFNVKRKQLYRDYYQLAYENYSDADVDYYLDPSNIFLFAHTKNLLDDFIAVMKITYANAIGGDSSQSVSASDTWYYQLDTTNYYLDKMIYIMLDFQDNNIIGYGAQNIWCGFDVTRIFQNMTDTINTPISYVDDNGCFKDIEIALCTNEQITTIYQEYQEEHNGTNWQNNLYNYSVFIPQDIFDSALENNKIHIEEENYKKDAIEVPVFEYCCQVDDSEDVLIGDNILTQHDGNIIYFYSYVMGDNLTQNNAYTNNTVQDLTSPLRYAVSNGVTISYSNQNKSLTFRLYNRQFYNILTGEWSNGTSQLFTKNKDFAIFRHTKNLLTGEQFAELMLILKKVRTNSANVSVKINHYKLK